MNQLEAISDYPFDLPPELVKLRDSINADMGKLFAARGQANTGASLEIPDGTLKQLEANAKQRFNDYQALCQEAHVRRRLRDEFYPGLRNACSRLRDGAFDAIEKAKVDVKQKLISIGYIDGKDPNTNVPFITNAMIAVHPTVIKAHQRYLSIDGHYHATEHAKINREKLDEIEGEIQEFLRRGAAA
jgi:hypothetical protein